MKNNIYKINYKSGNSLTVEAVGMMLRDGKLYQALKHYPFDNVTQSVIDGSQIASVELVEKNNDFAEEV